MRKKKVRTGIALLLALMAALALAGCPQEPEEVVFSDDASLVSIALDDVEGILSTAVSREDWDNPSFDIGAMPNGYFSLGNEADLEQVMVTVTTGHKGAKVQYGQGTNSDAPVNWNKTGIFYNLAKGDTVYVSVMSESGKKRNFYKMRLALQSDGTVATLSYFAVNDFGVVPSPSDNMAAVNPGTVWVDITASAQAIVTATPTSENAAVTTALVKRGNDYQNAVFYPPAAYELDDGDVLWVKCVSFDETATLYYAATVRIYNHITLTINNKPVTSIGRGGVNADTANFGSVAITSADAAADAVIKASPIPNSAAAVTGYQISSAAPSGTGWITPEADGSYIRTTAIPNANYLAIRVEDKFQQIYYYRVYIEVQRNVAALNGIIVGGVNATLGTPQTDPWSGTDNTGEVIIPPGAASPNATSVTVTSANGGVGSWAKAAGAAIIPAAGEFSSNPISGGLAAGNYIFIKAVSQDASATLYYKILVSDVKNNVVSLESAAIGTAAASNIGAGSSTLNVAAALRGAIAISPALAVQTGLTIKAAPAADSNAAVTGYAVVAGTNNAPTFTAPNANGEFTTTAAISNGQHLFVRVQAENGSLYYYRIVITVLSSNADLTAITVGSMAAGGLGTPQSDLWTGNDNTGTAIIPVREASPNATSVTVSSSAGAAATWAKAADANALPAAGDFKTGSIAGGLAAGNYLFVKAVSSDGTETQYYKILIQSVKSDVYTLESLAIGTVSITASGIGAGGTTVNVGTNYRGAISLTTAQAAAVGIDIKARPIAGSNAAVTGYAVAASSTTNPTFVEPNEGGGFTTTAAITNTQHLFVRVQTEIGTLYYYRIVITVQSNVATLTAITIGGMAAALGTPQSAPWNGTDNTGTVIIPPSAAAPNSTPVATTASQTNAVRTWAVAANADTIPAASAFSGTSPIAGGLAAGNCIFVKSVSQDNAATLYYKIQVASVKNNAATLSGRRSVFYVRPSFYYNLFDNFINAGASFEFAQDFGEGKYYQDSPYLRLVVEPQIRVNFSSAYVALVYQYRNEYHTIGKDETHKIHAVNLRVVYTF